MKAFDDDSGDSARHTKTGHVTLMKAFDDGSDDIQEGKKGLNAVNVKLARMGGGGGGGSSSGVMPFSGEVQQCDVDMVIPGRSLDFIWARTYRSRTHHTATLLGNGWSLSYDVSVEQGSSGITVNDGTGRRDVYSPGTNGVYTCPEFFREGTLTGGVFRLTFADTGYWEFNPFDSTATAGKLAQIVDRNGNTMSLGYDGSGHLAQIVDDLGRTNTVAYNPAGQVASVTDFTGRNVTYQYCQGTKDPNGSAGDLKSVTSPPVTGTPNGNDFPDGKTTTYTYSKSFPLDRENHLLLTVTDPKGQTAAVFSYEHNAAVPNYLHCIAAQEGTNLPSCFNWVLVTRPAGSYATTKCIANDTVGNVTESFFDARNRCVIERDYTGRATPGLPVTDAANRPTGKLRSSDPDYYEARWNWNNDSLCTLAVAPGGQQVQCVYQSDFAPSTSSARKRADLRVVRELATGAVDLNGDSVADVTDRSWHFDYDPRFGSDSTARKNMYDWIKASYDGLVPDGNGMAIKTKGTGADKNRVAAGGGPRLKGWDGTVKGLIVPDGNSVAIKTKGTGADPNRVINKGWDGTVKIGRIADSEDCNDSFVTSATDPRGNVTTGSYDANGNRIKVQFHWDRQGTADWDFACNSNGQLIAITNAPDANGRRSVDVIAYGSNPAATDYGRIAHIIHDANGVALTTSYEYDARGNVTRVVDPRTNDWLYTYNSLDQCVRAQSPVNISARCATDYYYDANDNLVQSATQVRDAADNLLPAGQTDHFVYDGLDRLTQIALAVDATHSLTNQFVYDGNDQCVQVLGGDAVSGADPHQTVAYQYDERGLLFHEIAAPGSSLAGTNQISYTANGNPATKQYVDAGDSLRISSFTYDGFDRLASASDPMGNQTVCFYDANDNLKVVRQFGELNDVPGSAGNVRLAESRCEYDGLDRCVRTHELFFDPATQSPIGSGEALTTFAYAPNDECVSGTDTLGHTTTYGYDTACRLVSVTDALGNRQSVVYDACANPLVEISSEQPAVGGPPQVFSVTNVYDSLSRCVSSTDSADNTSSCAYDSLARFVRVTDPNGNDTTYTYDLLDNCLATTDYAGSSSAKSATVIRSSFATFDLNSRCMASTDANGNTTSYAYDSLGRCTAITHADGTQEHLTWSPRNNLIRETDPNGMVSLNTYDLNDRLVHRDIATRFETFAYDGCDRLTGETDNDCNGAFAYDSLGNCVGETLNGLATTSTYDALGNRLSLTYPGGRSLAYAYDALNRCASITDSGRQLATYAYDGPDRVSLITYGNGTRTQIAYDGLAGTPNAAGDHGFGQVSRVRHEVSADKATIEDRTFGYDPDQNKTARDMTSPFTLGGAAQAMSFQYDPVCRLVNSLVTTNGAVARLVSYGLDRMGNRTNVTGVVCSGDYTMDATWPNPADFQMNQYTATPCDTRTYDDNGNLLSRSSPVTGPVSYQYDYADRLVQAQVVDFSGGPPVITTSTYAYDALGRRVSKSVSSGGSPPATTLFLYDGDSVIEEHENGEVSATYLDDDHSLLGLRRGGQDYYFHTDDQGNTLALTTTGSTVVERYDYDDYGAVTFLTSDGLPTSATSSAYGNVYYWGGLRLDAETGLHNNDGGGYFEPQTGRAVRGKVKSIRDNGSMGRAFSGNNPWSGGGGGGGGTEMKNGTVKFFNETKGFGMVVDGGSKTHTKTGHVTLMK
jgi:YD repeat-containing protein